MEKHVHTSKAVRTARHLVLSSLLIASGILLPSAFHIFSGGGSTFLPMHIPVLLAAFILPLRYSLTVAVFTPVMSSIIAGMPPIYPVLPIMTAELVFYAVTASFFSRKLRLNTYISLYAAMIFGRAAMLAAALILHSVSASFDGVSYFVKAIMTGLPGVILQLVALPPLITAAKKSMGYGAEQKL